MSKLTVYYDDKCSLCYNIKNIISTLDRDKKIAFEKLSDIEGDIDKLYAIDETGNKYYKEDAMFAISKILPGIKRFSWMFETQAGQKAGKIFYDSLEKIRKHTIKTGCTNC